MDLLTTNCVVVLRWSHVCLSTRSRRSQGVNNSSFLCSLHSAAWHSRCLFIQRLFFFSIGFHAVADIVLVSLLVHSRVCSIFLTVAVKYSLQFFTDFIIFPNYCIDTVLWQPRLGSMASEYLHSIKIGEFFEYRTIKMCLLSSNFGNNIHTPKFAEKLCRHWIESLAGLSRPAADRIKPQTLSPAYLAPSRPAGWQCAETIAPCKNSSMRSGCVTKFV